MKGLVAVVSSPSGGGKTTVIRRLLKRGHPSYVFSVSATTRPPRPRERDGHDYYFVSREEFQRMCESGELAEWAEVHGYFYGTPFKSIEAPLNEGRTVLMDIDIEGARSIRRIYPDDSLLIFVRPPSLEILKDRLRKRCTEEDSEIQKRLERVNREYEASSWFDHVVVNDDLDETVDAVEALIESRRKN